jgi:hypothetical protein
MTHRIFIVSLAALALTVGCDRSSNPKASSDSPASKEQSESTSGSSDESTSGSNSKASAGSASDDSKGSPEPNAPSGSKEGKPDLPEDLESGETGKYGADFELDGDPVPLATAMEQYSSKSGDEASGPYKVRARVEKVCKKKGCWFKLGGEGVDQMVRVRMKDYGFFVPRNSDGGEAIVEGELDQRTLSKKELRHYAKDQGKDPSEIDTEDRKRYEFTATAVQITMDS